MSSYCKCKSKGNNVTVVFSLKTAHHLCVEQLEKGGGTCSSVPPCASPSPAETFSVIGFPHLPRVCFLLTFNMFNRSLVIVPKTIKPVPAIQMIHIHNTLGCFFFFIMALVLFFSIIFSVKSCDRSKKASFTVTKAPKEMPSEGCLHRGRLGQKGLSLFCPSS